MMLHETGLLFVWAVLGGLLKYVDDAYDEGMHNKRAASVIGYVLAIPWLWLMSTSPGAASVLGSFMVAVVLAREIDILPFVVWTVLVAIGSVVLLALGVIKIEWGVFAVLSFTGFLEDTLSNYGERRPLPKPLFYLCEYLGVSFIALVVLVATKTISPWPAIGFGCFWAGYFSMRVWGRSMERRKSLVAATAIHEAQA
ncbi:MAG: hypothetical protein AB7O24_14785 [Kofleriaceae bacterium]